ncbi:glycosyl hydrolase family 18 protein [Acetivibrio ethanolgignens]|uniref:Glycoside hydrolase n=1 Tax=Acetivibrio ethanolgignens TaxID=290052 RepID=A0A0V8QD53_9FIRM|nr:glycosyl hydrolase family 18 protein [Acetivibrio ethanolgignens]KSV58482.1 glycoside hydrolase [Acetivibrio ethanolgignens]
MEIYIVVPGDTIELIAQKTESDVETLIYANQLVYPYSLAIGQALLIPGERQAERGIRTNGYAYTYIDSWVLSQTLPYLSELSVFSYGFTREGNLVNPPRDDIWMIEAARNAETVPILTLTPLDEEGRFSNYLITAIVENEAARENLISQVMETVRQKGYGGVDIDFEYIRREDRDGFTAFVAEMADALHAEGYQLSVALAPKTSADQPGLLYEGKDYGALGAIADQVLLMTYEWGYKYGPNMAVAPLNMVRRVVDYAITEIPAEKINLGIPNYGYDWPLPFVRGVTEARTIGNVEAVTIAIENSAVIQFDEIAKSPFFRYTRDGIEHEVWFEDARSINEKLGLVKEYGLKGTGWWQIMRLWRVGWIATDEQFFIEK